MSDGMLVAVAGIFGLVIGSFLNVCIVRLPAEQSIVSPRSRCPHCGSPLAWYDNLPLVSWLVLRGRCRGCATPISVLYPAVELATGLLWAWMAWRFDFSVLALKGALFATLLLGIAMTDARAYIIPDEFTIGGLVIGLVFAAVGGGEDLIRAVVGAGTGFLLLWVVGWAGTKMFKEEAMGGGDIKMMAMVGAFVGWQGVLLTIFLGALAGTLIFLPLSLMGRKKLVPFGVFLSIGAAVTYLVGPALTAWYVSLMGVA